MHKHVSSVIYLMQRNKCAGDENQKRTLCRKNLSILGLKVRITAKCICNNFYADFDIAFHGWLFFLCFSMEIIANEVCVSFSKWFDYFMHIVIIIMDFIIKHFAHTSWNTNKWHSKYGMLKAKLNNITYALHFNSFDVSVFDVYLCPLAKSINTRMCSTIAEYLNTAHAFTLASILISIKLKTFHLKRVNLLNLIRIPSHPFNCLIHVCIISITFCYDFSSVSIFAFPFNCRVRTHTHSHFVIEFQFQYLRIYACQINGF